MLDVRLLGGLRLAAEGRELPLPPTRRGQELLVWLALRPGVHPRSLVAGSLGAEVSEEAARRMLRQALWAVRGALGDEASEALVVRRDVLGLAPGRLTVDLERLRHLAEQGDPGAFVELDQPLVPELEADWLAPPRAELREMLARLAAEHAAAAEERGEVHEALEWASRRRKHAPSSETAEREWIRLLAASGDRARALRAADDLRRRLSDELGVTPAPQTRAVIEQVLSDEPADVRPSRPFPEPLALPQPLSTLDALPLVGRDAELQLLAQAWQDAVAGQPSVRLLGGDPGVGKTRLAAEAARRAHREGGAVLFGGCDPGALVPYQPFAQALEPALVQGLAADLAAVHASELHRALPGLARASVADPPTVDEPELARYRLFEAIRAAIGACAAGQPVLLLLDDLHWAAPATVALLLHLVRSLAGERLLILATHRDTALDLDGTAFGEALAELRRRPGVVSSELQPLDEAALERLVTTLSNPHTAAGFAEQLHRETGGNPLFAIETLRDLGDRSQRGQRDPGPPPAAVRGVLEQRLARLGPSAQPVLRAAAIAGETFHVRDLAEASDQAGGTVLDVVDAAVGARLLREAPGPDSTHAFAHALVADTVRAGLTSARRADLHARLGTILAARGAPATSVAAHLLAAGTAADPAVTVRWALAAAQEQRTALAYDEAARLLLQAVAAAGRGISNAQRTNLLLDAGEALDHAGDASGARQRFVQAAAAARIDGDPELLGRAALGHRGLGVTITAPNQDTIEILNEALAAGPSKPLRARLTAALALEYCYLDPGQSAQLSASALELARPTSDEAVIAEALSARHAVLWNAEGAEQRLAVADEMLARARGGKDPIAALQARHWRVLDLLELGRVQESELETTTYASEADRLRLVRFQWYTPLWRAAIALLRGDEQEATSQAALAEQLGAKSGDPNAPSHTWIQQMQILLEHGRSSEIDLERAEDAARDSPAGPGAWLGWLAVACHRRGELDRGRRHYEALAADDFAALPGGPNWHTLCEAAEAATLFSDQQGAALLAPRLRPFRDLNPVVGRGIACYGPVGYYAARAESCAGDSEAAVELYLGALQACERLGAKPQGARIRARLQELGHPSPD